MSVPVRFYFQDLETGEERRITTTPPANTGLRWDGSVIVGQDNRNGQQELYAFDLRGRTRDAPDDTPYDETSPAVHGDWVFFAENALGRRLENLRLLHLASLRHAPMTRSETQKQYPALLTRTTAWLDVTSGRNARGGRSDALVAGCLCRAQCGTGHRADARHSLHRVSTA
jgi:Tol biopolymer transport system component